MQKHVVAALRDMLGPNVGIGATDPRDATDDLWPEERTAIAAAIPKRQHEFAAGRRAARQALAALGLPSAAIAVGAQRAPIWPKGLTGSIAHCDTLCIAAVSQFHQCIGVDIEPATPLAADLIEIVCTQTEQAFITTLPAKDQGIAAKRLFCAKEAVFKAQYPLTQRMIGFDDVSIRLDGPDGFEVNWHNPMPELPSLRGLLQIRAGMILATASI